MEKKSLPIRSLEACATFERAWRTQHWVHCASEYCVSLQMGMEIFSTPFSSMTAANLGEIWLHQLSHNQRHKNSQIWGLLERNMCLIHP